MAVPYAWHHMWWEHSYAARPADTSSITPASWLSSSSVCKSHPGQLCPLCREQILQAPMDVDDWRENLIHMTELVGQNAHAILGDEL